MMLWQNSAQVKAILRGSEMLMYSMWTAFLPYFSLSQLGTQVAGQPAK